MQTVKTWLAVWSVILSGLVVCGWLDRPIEPTACVAEIHDSVGNTHYISGQVARVSTN